MRYAMREAAIRTFNNTLPSLDMIKLRPLRVFAVAAIAGGITRWLIPNDWFPYVLGACMVGLLIFGALAAGSEYRKEPDPLGPIWWFVIGTDRPMAKIKDPEALALFFLILAYLAGFTVGVFAAIHA